MRQTSATGRWVLALVPALLMPFLPADAVQFFVSPSGSDQADGTLERPFATLAQAQSAARLRSDKNSTATICLREGTYYLNAPLIFTAADSGSASAPVIYSAWQNERPVLSGGVPLSLDWKPFHENVFQAAVPPDLDTDQLFVNGEQQVLARYPNFNPNERIFNGYAEDAIAPARVARWANPAGGLFHAMHPAMWGDYTFLLTGKDTKGEATMTGGWQNNRGTAIHAKHRFVENIFEELDAPGEWFLDRKARLLYFYPPAGLDLSRATIEAVRLRNLVEFKGDEQAPVRFLSLKGLTFRHAARTVMDTKEPLARTDWRICRAGAIMVNGTEDCALENVFLDQVGGNAVFVNNYNRRFTLRGAHINRAGASGVVFLGDPAAVRNPLFNYSDPVPSLDKIDRTPGPLTSNYPSDSLVEDCLINFTGRVEKQTAGVTIDLSRNITVRHCTVANVPRAGINIGDGCWGGHVIEFCDVFNTVLETGDHGAFNSWGRDRFWQPDTNKINAVVQQAPELPFLDVVAPIVLRNNRWRCDHGWDIDLDDGSSNYEITNNLCLNGGIKNREGYRRKVENNIMVNNSLNPHCWLIASGDIFRRNIVMSGYLAARMPAPPWEQDLDSNFLHRPGAKSTSSAADLQKGSGKDAASLQGDALFIAPETGDYRVRDGSPALTIGFVNFPMDQFGVTSPALRALAPVPVLPGEKKTPATAAPRDTSEKEILGASLRNIANEGEMSAYGLPGVTGVLALRISQESLLARAGMETNDVILSLNGQNVGDISELLQHLGGVKSGEKAELKVMRNQKPLSVSIEISN